MIQFQLRLQSFDKIFLQHALSYFIEITQLLGAFPRVVMLPQKLQKLTVLRSPHIDKKARDQFQKRTWKVLFECKFQNFQKAGLFFELLKNSRVPGIQLEIHWKTSGYFFIQSQFY